MKTWNGVVLGIAVVIGLTLGLNIINALAGDEVAHFFDQLLIAGTVAYGIVYRFF